VLLTVGFFLLCAEQTHAIIRKLADTDPLTGVLNRRSVLLFAANRIASADRHHHSFSCVMIDLDNLKDINDVYGHAAGDRALETITSVVSQLKRTEDLLGRLGGDEFVVFLPYCDIEGAEKLAERSRTGISQEILLHDGNEYSVTASFGVACLKDTDESPLDILSRADKAMYEAKAQGGNKVKTTQS
jgi:diguanylate cyclase (GGDEF)-like protein